MTAPEVSAPPPQLRVVNHQGHVAIVFSEPVQTFMFTKQAAKKIAAALVSAALK